jgi:hypothetical protein
LPGHWANPALAIWGWQGAIVAALQQFRVPGAKIRGKRPFTPQQAALSRLAF